MFSRHGIGLKKIKISEFWRGGNKLQNAPFKLNDNEYFFKTKGNIELGPDRCVSPLIESLPQRTADVLSKLQLIV